MNVQIWFLLELDVLALMPKKFNYNKVFQQQIRLEKSQRLFKN